MKIPAITSSQHHFARTLHQEEGWDVLVLGGGPAGCTAAAAAARAGAKTLLVESTGCLGGMGTSGLVPAWTPFSDKEKVIYRGLAEKVFRECCAGMSHLPKNAVDWVAIDPERLKRVYDDLVTQAGANVRFHTQLAAVERSGDIIDSVILANKSGLSVCRAKVYIDCTGDADLCAWAGADFQKGNAQGERLMPATHCFILTNVDTEVLQSRPNIHGNNPQSLIYDILKSGKYPLIPDSHACVAVIGARTVGFNAGHIWNVDNTNPHSVSNALIQGRKMAEQYRQALAEYYPEAFAHAFLVTTGSLMGIRETRRITGDYVLTLEDFIARRTFPDEICRNCYFIDVHWAKDEISARPDEYAKWDAKCLYYHPGESHGIPYRSLIPVGLDNVLVAGRSISCEQIVQGSIRVMPVCLAMGEAAGLAGATAATQHAGFVREIDPHQLRAELRDAGAYLPELEPVMESVS